MALSGINYYRLTLYI